MDPWPPSGNSVGPATWEMPGLLVLLNAVLLQGIAGLMSSGKSVPPPMLLHSPIAGGGLGL